MADTTTGITIAELEPTTTLSSTDCFEIDRDGGAYSVTYETLTAQLEQSLGLNELADALTNIIG